MEVFYNLQQILIQFSFATDNVLLANIHYQLIVIITVHSSPKYWLFGI